MRRVRCVVDDLVVCRNCIGDGRRFDDALCVGKRREKDDVEVTCFGVCVCRGGGAYGGKWRCGARAVRCCLVKGEDPWSVG